MCIRPYYGRGCLLAFTVPTGKDLTRASTFAKAFYGQETSSHHGKYRYRRHGLPDEIPSNKLMRRVIIIRAAEVGRVAGTLEQHSAKYHVRMVKPTLEAREAMKRSVE